MGAVATEAIGILAQRDLSGFWVHLDADVLDDGDHARGGLSATERSFPEDLITLLRACARSGALRGVSVAILQSSSWIPSGAAGRLLVKCLGEGLA